MYRVGNFEEDVVCLADELPPPRAQRVLRPVVLGGRIVAGSLPPISEVWERAREQLQALPERYRALSGAPTYPVRFSERLQALRAATMASANGGGAPLPPSLAVEVEAGRAASEAPSDN